MRLLDRLSKLVPIAVFALLGTVTLPARAQDPTSCDIVRKDAEPGLMLDCQRSYCGDEGCVRFEGNGECIPVGDSNELCVRTCTRLFGCTSDQDCPRLGRGDPAATYCASLSSELTLAAPTGLCLYTDEALRITYCVDISGSSPTVTVDNFARCHTRVNGTLTTDYHHGDCDGDGCPNGSDVDPCNPGDGSACDTIAPRGDDSSCWERRPPRFIPVDEPVDESSFGGGGGCRCGVVGSRGRALPAALLLSALAAAISMLRRTR